MKIVIYSPTGTELDINSIENRPLGGADQALIRTIKTLQMEHEVVAFLPTFKAIGGLYHHQDIFSTEEQADIFIINRVAGVVPSTIEYKKLIFYSQDDIDAPCMSNANEDYFKRFDKIIILSDYHKRRFKDAYNISDHKFIKIGNGADPNIRINKDPNKFIYASTPFRGLPPLVKIWKEITKLNPKYRLHVFSSMKIYDAEHYDELYFNRLYEIIKKIPSIVYHGSTTQKEVLRHMREAKLLLYPCTFPETYCNVINEARASNTPFITTELGALKETGGSAGIFIDDSPYTPKYQEMFIDAFKKIMESESFYQILLNNCKNYRTWLNHKSDILEMVKNVSKR